MDPLISASDLRERIDEPMLRIVDVRFDLTEPSAGRSRYAHGHLPGATYLHLDDDLSGPLRPDGIGGRHPLPDPERLAATLGRHGIGDEHEVVVYDDAGGAFAGRLWWLLHWIGRPAARVLDGGVQAWTAIGGALETAVPDRPAAWSSATPDPSMLVSVDRVRAWAADPNAVVIDARARERYLGETEPLDRKAGHVPGAVNLPFAENLSTDGLFLPPERLRERFSVAVEPTDVAVYCGSGVSAVHDVLAMVRAGLPMPRLYAGSWSDWSSRDDYPVATGEESDHAPHESQG